MNLDGTAYDESDTLVIKDQDVMVETSVQRSITVKFRAKYQMSDEWSSEEH